MTSLYVFQGQKLERRVKLRNIWDDIRSRGPGEDVDWRRRALESAQDEDGSGEMARWRL